MSIKTVLTIATFTEGSENALERAAELAGQQRAALAVLHRYGGDAPHPIDRQHRLALRCLQLARRYGIEARPLHLGPPRLSRMLESKAQELLLVVDVATAQRRSAGWATRRKLLDRSPCPILVVKRPRGNGAKLALLPYRTAQDAARSLAFARAFAPDHALELFFAGPQQPPSLAHRVTREELHLKEWPPPTPGVVRHSDYLSTRLNRAIPAFDTASLARRIRNQADFNAADLVIAPHVASSWAERIVGRSLHERLLSELRCDLLLLPDPGCHRTALTAAERLQAQAPASWQALPVVQEHRHV